METTTLYVSRDADYDDLSKEKIYTVIYQYDYEESDEDGKHITPISERHVVRIHILFENGIPTVEDIREPDVVLPGTSITMRVPGVTSNGYEIIGGGWELFENKPDAESHFNGMEYQPNVKPLYWYQDEFYLAYYAKTFNRGKTYSNIVPVHVANYHDLKEVMDDKENHLHVDYDRTRLKRDAKIYINDYTTNDPATSQNGLQLFSDLYDLSLMTPGVDELDANGLYKSGTFEGHKPLNNSPATGTNIYDTKTYTKGVKAGKNLEFFFRTDIDHAKKWVTNPDYDANDPAETDPEFIQVNNPWTPIGTDEQCFQGTVHGDGYTISGLDNSLFYNLCGDVYNLGVMGSFTTAGVVDKGNGYVESCWTSTTGTPSNGDVYAVFGNPSRTSEEIAAHGKVQLVNSYYQEGKTYKTTAADHGVATTKPAKAYYDGELAYDLNSFYLNKRYYQGTNQSSGTEYKYWPVQDDGTLPTDVSKGYYPIDINDYAPYCNLGYVEARFADGDYRYAAGEIPSSEDERYYEEKDKNSSGEDVVISTGYYPIWPDDYLFFGQALNYNHVEGRVHQDVPTAVKRNGGRIDKTESGNRVFRAPAYYRSKDMSVAHFNPYAVFAQKSADGTKIAYPQMTAIDFTDAKFGSVDSYKAYEKGLRIATIDGKATNVFYPPLLDDDGLSGFKNIDLTQNLLVYTAATGTSAAGITATTVSNYLTDPTYSELDTPETPARYRAVAGQDIGKIHGHWVQQTGSEYVALRDHLLVDKQDFNAPISYKFGDAYRMWYQRRPDNFVDISSGWEGISLPFTVDLVTTDQKGEITHFYSGSSTSANSDKKIGHEYWLREFDGIDTSVSPMLADFNYPIASSADFDKDVTNDFLWEYYYEAILGHNHKDYNKDTYQTYYKADGNGLVNQFQHYARQKSGMPYLIGFPGATYYEFDLSGEFKATTTAAPNPVKLNKQVITFASATGESIGISDKETTGVTKEGYTFKPSYMNETLEAGNFVINSDGNAYVQLSDVTETYSTTSSTYADATEFATAKAAAVDGKLYTDEFGTVEAGSYADASTVYYSRESDVPLYTTTGSTYADAAAFATAKAAAVGGKLYTNELGTEEALDYANASTVYYSRVLITKNNRNNITSALSAFRPYFIGSSSPVKEFKGETRSIIFSRNTAEMNGQEDDDINDTGELIIRGRDGRILVTSMLQEAKDIIIVTSAGALIDRYTIQPGDTRETKVNASGVYIVNNKKIAVKIKD